MTVRTVVEASKAAALLAVVFLCVALGITVLHLGTTVKKVDADLDELHSTLVIARKLANDGRVTVDNINKAAIDQRFYFEKEMPRTLGQVNAILGDADKLLAAATQTTKDLNTSQFIVTTHTVAAIDRSNQTMNNVDTVLASVNDNLITLGTTEKDLDTLVKSPDIVGTLHNINSSTAHVDATLGDVQEEVHKITHPKPIVSVINWALKISHAVGVWF